MSRKFDFSGWATKNDLRCADGRIIRRDAFKDNDGQTVPLVYQHQHTDPMNILGHALLENRDEGVYAYCSFNNTESAQHVKEAVQHGDVVSLSIYANKLDQQGNNVLHGQIREVSIVLAGANPGAYIDNPILVHGEGTENETYEDDYTEAIIYADSDISLYHADSDDEEDDKDEGNDNNEEDTTMAKEDNGRTVQDVFDEFTDEQKKVVYYMIGQALEDQDDDDEEVDEDEDYDEDEDEDMKHNVFEDDYMYGPVLSHADEMDILESAKQYGKLSDAIYAFEEENGLEHSGLAAVSGFTSYPADGNPANIDSVFPDWHDVRPGAPEIVTDDQAWVEAILSKVHKSPYSRIRTSQVDLRSIEGLRGKGYLKGNEKTLLANYAVALRTTEPQTIYVKSALNRDDIVDITDFDYVEYQYKIDRMLLRKELALAILIGDGRAIGSADKINPERIRPIWGDNEIFTIRRTLNIAANSNGTNTAANFGAGYLYAQAMEETLLDAKIDYRGSGAMDMFCDQAFYNKMLLAKDLNGRRIYNNQGELKSALEVNNIYNVPDLKNKTRTEGEGTSAKTYRLLAIIGNFSDYNVGATKGGEITHFNQFDIDFNQEKSLLETRVSGANTRIYSFIVIEEEVTE